MSKLGVSAVSVALVGGASLMAMNTQAFVGGVSIQTQEKAVEHTPSKENSEEPTLWGIYGHHSVHDCPLNHREHAEYVVAASKADFGPLFDKYGITDIRDRYHSGLEHTFLWAVETTRPHDLERFAVELGIAGWNDLTIVPLITFEDGVVPMVAEVHGIE